MEILTVAAFIDSLNTAVTLFLAAFTCVPGETVGAVVSGFPPFPEPPLPHQALSIKMLEITRRMFAGKILIKTPNYVRHKIITDRYWEIAHFSKHRLNDLANVLHRPIEIAGNHSALTTLTRLI